MLEKIILDAILCKNSRKSRSFYYMKTKVGRYYEFNFFVFFSYSLKINQNDTAENDISMACKFEPHFEFSNVKLV